MQAELIEQIQQLQQESEQAEERVLFIDRQAGELTEFLGHLSFLENTQEKEVISSLGKGLFIETSLKSKTLLVDVGASVLAKKTIPEVQATISSQLATLREMRKDADARLHEIHDNFELLVSRLETRDEEDD